MKKMLVKRICIIGEDDKIEKLLTDAINDECPHGYHYKETIDFRYSEFKKFDSIQVFVAFEED